MVYPATVKWRPRRPFSQGKNYNYMIIILIILNHVFTIKTNLLLSQAYIICLRLILFGFAIFWFWAYLMKVIPETYLMKVIPETLPDEGYPRNVTWWRLSQKRTWWRLSQKRTWWRLSQKRVVRTKFDIYFFIFIDWVVALPVCIFRGAYTFIIPHCAD